MKALAFIFLFFYLTQAVFGSEFRPKRQAQQQLPPIANGEVLTSAFQIPIQTLNAVHDLVQATRGRFNALQERYQIQQQQHPNHKLNPHFVLPDSWKRPEKRTQQFSQRRQFNSKALHQPRTNSRQRREQ